ncbi:MAG: tRNA pseudouridine(38-40) synthase TruA [Tissierellales bacterium]|nr:tRNA pseudouridine(38-40) synthase TruA [Tissierellales bacterium]
MEQELKPIKYYKIQIEYDGTEFYGWQRQNDDSLRTVQGEIEKALYRLFNENITIDGSGRTDKGVHAKNQTATFSIESTIPGSRLKYPLNSLLPDDIYINDSSEVKEGFHARYSAKGKEYYYRFYCSEQRSPLKDRYSAYVPSDVDLDRMVIATKKLLGKHDFGAFMASGSSVKTTERIVHSIEMKKYGNEYTMYIRGNGFLYNMVRIIMGTLIEIGLGRKSIECIDLAFETLDREVLGYTAPARGLYLNKVFYDTFEN